MDLAATSFLVFRSSGGWDYARNEWSRLEIGDSSWVKRGFATPTGFVPLPRDHDCFQHIPERYQRDLRASMQTDGKLFPYLSSAPHLRILPAAGSVKNGAVIVHYLGDRDERVARIHRFEAPGATVPFARFEIPIFHVLPPDLVKEIVSHYVQTCSVPDSSGRGIGLTWVPWRKGSIGWG
jgi:hypothetical protein